MVVDSHPLVRLGAATFLARTERVEVVAGAGSCREALEKAADEQPDVILMEIELPDGDGLALTRRLQTELPPVKVVIFTGRHMSEFALHMIQAGARGFVSKTSQMEEVLQAIEKVKRGETYFTDEAAQGVLAMYVNKEGASKAMLSPREVQVLTQIADGLGNKQIAWMFGLSLRTVETHRERLMTKLGIHSIAGLTRFALTNGHAALPFASRQSPASLAVPV